MKNWYKVFLIWFWSLFFGGILIISLSMWAIISGAWGYMPPFEELQNPKNTFASEIITSDNQSLGRYYRYENRVGVHYEDLSDTLVMALIATEDARFYNHTGVDFKSLFRAVLKLGRAGGGSTITQQLAKQLWSPRANNILERAMQKPIEWIIATKLERLYSKDEILLMYLNQFDFLYNAVGIQSASQVYFSTTPKDLKIEEAAMLVGMCKNPSLYNPVRHPERARNRRNTVLSQMEKYGYIDKATCDSVSALPLTLHYRSVDHKQGSAPYFREYLRVMLTAKEPNESDYPSWNKQQYKIDRYQWDNNDLYGFCEKNRKADGSKYDIYQDGLKIYTTIDSRMQKYAEEAVDEHMRAQQVSFFKELKRKKNAPFSRSLTQEEIDAAAAALKAAVDALEEKPGFLFDDVQDEAAFYFDPVYWAYNHEPQVTDGVTETTFEPDSSVTRGQAVTFLWRAAGKPAAENATNPFNDVKEGDYFYEAVLWAVEKGITDGTTETTFSPNDTCTKAHIITFTWRFNGEPKAAIENPFEDVAEGDWFYAPALWAAENGISDEATGTTATAFNGADTCTRGQSVTFLYRSVEE